MCYFLLGSIHWFGFLGGMRCRRDQLRVLNRMYQYMSLWDVRALTSDFIFIFLADL